MIVHAHLYMLFRVRQIERRRLRARTPARTASETFDKCLWPVFVISIVVQKLSLILAHIQQQFEIFLWNSFGCRNASSLVERASDQWHDDGRDHRRLRRLHPSNHGILRNVRRTHWSPVEVTTLCFNVSATVMKVVYVTREVDAKSWSLEIS